MKKKDRYCIVWDKDLNSQDVDMETAIADGREDLACLDKNIKTVYICKIVKKMEKVIKITPYK
jgi:hypothetical protein